MIDSLVKRARLQNIEVHNTTLNTLREMLTRNYEPPNGFFLPEFRPGTSRHAAFKRALEQVDTAVPGIVSKTLGGLDFAGISWSDTSSTSTTEQVNDAVAALNLPELGKKIAEEYILTGVTAVLASYPLVNGQPAGHPELTLLRGVNMPYTSPVNPDKVTGWYRAIQYFDENRDGKLRWWVDATEFHADGTSTVRVWRSLESPTDLGHAPSEEFPSTARPRFAIHTLQPNGLPTSALLANLGKIQALYASELRLAATEEMSSFPMLLTKGDVEMNQVGPAEVIGVDAEGDARWLDPGSLEELRQQVALRRGDVRDALNLPTSVTGTGNTPSGLALQEANRAFMQSAADLSNVTSSVLTQGVSDYLALLGLPPVDVHVPVDRAYLAASLIGVVEKGLDYDVLPTSVAARMFQTFLGGHYSDEELEKFLEERTAREAVHSFLTRQEEAES